MSSSISARYVSAAAPYSWPFDGDLRSANTALLVIDMQRDFCSPGGYADRMGYDIGPLRACIEPIRCLLGPCRHLGYTIIYTREGHRPDLADLPPNKLYRSEKIGAAIGSQGPLGKILIRGEHGWDVVEELTPRDGDIIVDKSGKGSFYATDLDLILRRAGIRNLALCGVTTDVCVHTTLREANDRGYECLVLSDCTAATDAGNHHAALKQITMQGGVFGAHATSKHLLSCLLQGTTE